MDEKKLAELMRSVVAETPPATFSQDDVARESARQQVRHRNGVLAGSAFGVALLAGATALGVALWTGPGTGSETASAGDFASPSNGNAAPYEVPSEGAGAAPQTERGDQRADSSSEAPKQGGPSDEDGGPAGPTSTPSGCEQVDRELAAALAGELPATAGLKVSDAVDVSLACPAGATGARYDLADGRITVLLAPPDVMLPTWSLSSGSVRGTAVTDDGATVAVVSEPFEPDAPAPFAADVQTVATELAQLY